MIEIWKDIGGFEGIYQVSNFGRVKSLARMKIRPRAGNFFMQERILQRIKTRYGYLVVSLCVNGKQRQTLVHRLVAEAFVDRVENKPFVNHMDTIKSNNNVSNLEWVTAKENAAHAVKNGLYKLKVGEQNPMFGRFGAKNVNSKKVAQVDINTESIVNIFDSASDASRELNISRGNISSVCCGVRNICGGYKWGYV